MSYFFGSVAQSIMSRSNDVAPAAGDPFYDDVEFYINAQTGLNRGAHQDWGPKRRTLQMRSSGFRFLQDTAPNQNPYSIGTPSANGRGLGASPMVGTNYATSNFTIDLWVYPVGGTSVTTANVIDDNIFSLNITGGFAIGQARKVFNSSIYFAVYFSDSGAVNPEIIFSTNPMPLNTWSHLAVVRQGGNIRFYVNGVLQTMATGRTNITWGTTAHPNFLAPGNGALSSVSFNGRADAIRFTKAARWSADFNPADARYLPPNDDGDPYWDNVVFLSQVHGMPGVVAASHYDGGRGGFAPTTNSLEVSTAQFKFGHASYYANSTFRGFEFTGDVALARMNGQSFTAEAWVRSDGSWSGTGIMGVYTTGTNQRQWSLGFNAGGVPRILLSSLGSNFAEVVSSAGALPTNTWVHVAMDYDVTEGKAWLYVDGVLRGTLVHTTGLFASTAPFLVHGYNTAGSGAFVGYSAHHRLTRGVARYQGNNFAVPTAAYPMYKKI
jgi:hypothetical protein